MEMYCTAIEQKGERREQRMENRGESSAEKRVEDREITMCRGQRNSAYREQDVKTFRCNNENNENTYRYLQLVVHGHRPLLLLLLPGYIG
jgi:hypothetical protein